MTQSSIESPSNARHIDALAKSQTESDESFRDLARDVDTLRTELRSLEQWVSDNQRSRSQPTLGEREAYDSGYARGKEVALERGEARDFTRGMSRK